MLQAAYPPIIDQHTGMDMVPLLLQGWSGGSGSGGHAHNGQQHVTGQQHMTGQQSAAPPPPATSHAPAGQTCHVDFSTYHTLVLCAGTTVVGAAVVGLLGGGAAAEVPLLGVRPELQCNGLGRVLLAGVERICLEAGVGEVLVPCMLPYGAGMWVWGGGGGVGVDVHVCLIMYMYEYNTQYMNPRHTLHEPKTQVRYALNLPYHSHGLPAVATPQLPSPSVS